MCDYCEKEKNLSLHRQHTDTNITEIFIHTERDGGGLFLRQPMWKIEDDRVRVRLTTDYAYLDIKYCPFCGKELIYVDKKKEYLDKLSIDVPKF